MSDRMVSCVRLFAFRKDISMNNKDRKRQIAYEVLMILGSLALLTFICRLWPILLLIILGILSQRSDCCFYPAIVLTR